MGLYLESRLDFLVRTQNPDGGWGYFSGKSSWLEPTAYSMLALNGRPEAERAWKLVRGWQTADGGFQPSGSVQGATWVTSLVITVASARGEYDPSIARAVAWLLNDTGNETRPMMRLYGWLGLLKTKADMTHDAWPWRPGTSSWIEPTAQALVALKKVAGKYGTRELAGRVREGENQILSRRCSDGGWNCGNPNVLNIDLPSYPETTALALLGLAGRSPSELRAPLQVANHWLGETRSSLAKAWLTIALRNHGLPVPDPSEAPSAGPDVMLTAIEALGHSQGNHRLLAAGKTA